MIGFLLTLIFGGVLVAVLAAAGELRPMSTFAKIVVGGFLLRLLLQFFLREIPFFSHGAGADCIFYEENARLIATSWRMNGDIRFITSAEMPTIGPTSLPPNLFALLIWINEGQTTRLASTALVALAASLTVLNIYKLAIQFGAERRNALIVATIIYFEPAFLFYTSDTYKDGLVVCLTMAAIGSALRLSSRVSIVHALVGIVALWGLWYVRFYLLFVTAAPLLVGIAGFGSKSIRRPLVATLVLAIVGISLAGLTDILQLASDRANTTFELATASHVLGANAQGGSGVQFDDDGVPYQALLPKMAYTLFAPFLWAGGSVGFQIGKLDVLLWYFVIYRAVRAARQTNPLLVLMLASFLVPSTVMYAMTMSNVGLIVRQRLVIVAATAVLAAIYRPQKGPARREVRASPRLLPRRRAAA